MSTKRKQVALAVAGSVGIHLVVLFAWALSVQWFPDAQAASVQTPEQMKLEIVEDKPVTPPPIEPDPLPKAPTPKPIRFKDLGDTADMPEASQAPKDPAVQSDRNSEAASELPATGSQPLPTQKGRKIPNFAFDTHPYVPGEEGIAAGQNVPQNMPPVPATAPPPPRPAPTPLAQSTPLPAATPTESLPADPRDLAMLAPKSIPSTPVDPEPNPYDPSFRPPAAMTEPPRPTPVPRRGGYQTFQQRTQADGGIGKSGVGSVASAATPAGRYIASVVATAKRRYYQFVDARADIITVGSIQVRFTVDRDGKVHGTHVVSNTGNEALASIALRAVAEAQFPSMPTEVAATFDGGIMPMSINFTLEQN